MSEPQGRPTLRRWAHFRLSVVGPLLAAPPAPGTLQQALDELAARTWVHPVHGTRVRIGRSTLERWYYAALRAADPVSALGRQRRRDAGQTRVMSAALLEALAQQVRDYPRWSYTLHADNLVVLAEQCPQRYGSAPSYSTVRRRMHAHGWRPRRLPRRATEGQRRAAERLEQREVRSFEVSHVHALWHLDFHVARRRRIVDARGEHHDLVAFAVLDDYSRLCCHVQWYLTENAENLVHGLVQAFHKRGLPRTIIHDNGSAMRAHETQNGLRDLGIQSRFTLPYSAYQNGKQEHFWGPLEGRLMAMLERVEPLRLDFLNRATLAWVELEYHRAVHSEIGCTPLDRALHGHDVARAVPDADRLRRAFTDEFTRTPRRSDGTFTVGGVRYELPNRLRTLRRITVRAAAWDRSTAWVIDPNTGDVLASVTPLDKQANAEGRRRALQPLDPTSPPDEPRSNGDVLPPLMHKLLDEFAATGLPAPYLPKDERRLDTEPHAGSAHTTPEPDHD